MFTLDSLLELGVNIHRHLRVGVADLIHDPLEVEFTGEQQDRDVGPSEAVRRDVRQRRQPSLAHLLAGEVSRLADDFSDALAAHSVAAFVLEEVRLGSGVVAGFGKPVDVLDEHFREVGADLYDPYAGLGLGVGYMKPGILKVV